jgi:polar amino acid transport system substrate-binding protein
VTPVDARRPALYVAVGAVLALVASIVVGAGSAAGEGPAPAQQAPPTAAAPAPPCSGVTRSLRPLGPLPPAGQMPEGTTMSAIAARGLLRAGVDQGKYLSAYRDPHTGDLQGADIDVVRSIAKALFGDATKVRFVVLNIADRASAIEKGQVDMVVNTFSVTCDRQRRVAFSAPYMTAKQRILVDRDSGIHEVEDLAGRTVCTSAGSTTEGVLRRYAGVTVETLPGIPDCMLELQAGRAAAVSSDDVILAGLAAQDPQTDVVGRALDLADYAVGLPLGSDDMVRFVNGVLDAGRADGSLAAADRRWFGSHLSPVPQPPRAVYRD